MQAIELGYRGVLKGFNYDLNGYYNMYKNFIGNLNVLAPLYGTVTQAHDFVQGAPTYITNPGVQSVIALANGDTRTFQLYTNTKPEITSLGFGFGLSKRLNKTFELSGNYNFAEFQYDQALDPSFEAGFNTPKHRAKASLSADKLIGDLGFNLSGRWNSSYLYQSNFADGMIKEATVIDLQINYGIPSMKSIFKVGGTNLGGREYRQIVGAGAIGQQFYASWTVTP